MFLSVFPSLLLHLLEGLGCLFFFFPPAGTILRLKGSTLLMAFLDCNGSLITAPYEPWKDVSRESKDSRDKSKWLSQVVKHLLLTTAVWVHILSEPF